MFPVTVLLTTVQSVEPSVSLTARSPGPEKRLPRTTTPGKCRSKTAWAPLTAQVLPSKMIAVCPAGASRVPVVVGGDQALNVDVGPSSGVNTPVASPAKGTNTAPDSGRSSQTVFRDGNTVAARGTRCVDHP